MKTKRFTVLLSLVMMFMLIFANVAYAGTISNVLKATFTVGGGSAGTEVKTAAELTAALADPTVTTINLAAGTYEGQFNITRDVTLVGNADGGSIIQSPQALDKMFACSVSGTAKDYRPIITVSNSATVSIKNIVVDGNNMGNSNIGFTGIGIYNANATIDNVEVKNIMCNPFSGAQYGIGIAALNDNGTHNVTIENSDLYGYQKGGMVLSGAGLTANVNNNTVKGAGATTVTCQNGIQLSYGAEGSMTNNNVSDHVYTKDDEWKGGACGILVWQAGEQVAASDNSYSNNDNNFNRDGITPVALTGSIGETAINESGADINVNAGDTVTLNVTAKVNGLQEFYDAKLVLDLDDITGVTVKVGENTITPSNGVFELGNVQNIVEDQSYTATIIFESAGTYNAEVYVVE